MGRTILARRGYNTGSVGPLAHSEKLKRDPNSTWNLGAPTKVPGTWRATAQATWLVLARARVEVPLQHSRWLQNGLDAV
jgi:hypothetical protein